MITIIFIILIFLKGWLFSGLIGLDTERFSFRAAMSGFLGILLTTLSVYAFSTFSYAIETHALQIYFLVELIVLLFLRRHHLLKEISHLFFLLFSNLKLSTFLLILLYQSTMMFGMSGLKGGDGQTNWAWKAYRWDDRNAIIFNEKDETKKNFKVIASYPIFHSVGMLANLKLLPINKEVAVKTFDFIYYLSTIFLTFYFLSIFRLSLSLNLFWTMMIVFAQRALWGLLNAGYAEINIAFFILAFFVMIFRNLKNLTRLSASEYLILGLMTGAAITTKNEGFYKLVIVLIGLGLVYRARLFKAFNLNGIIIFLMSCLFIKYLDKYNIPVSFSYNEYSENLNLSWSHLSSQFPVIIKAAIYSVFGKISIKSAWIPCVILNTYLFIKLTFSNNFLKEYKDLFYSATLIFYGAFAFNCLPMLIATPPDTFNSDYQSIGENLISRLNNQTGVFLFISIFVYWYGINRKKGV